MGTFNARRRNNGISQLGTNAGDANNLMLAYGNIVRASWTANGPSVFRPLPGLNPDDNYKTFDKCFVEGEFGTWAQAVPVVQYAFEKKLSFTVAADLYDEDWRQSPYYMLWNAVYKYAKSDMALGYYARMVDRDNRERILPAPEKVVLMPVLTWYRNDKEAPVENLSAVDILMLKESVFIPVRNYLMAQLHSEPLDVVAPESGAFLVLWNKSKRTPLGVPEHCIMRQRSTFGYDAALVQKFPQLYTAMDGQPAVLTQTQLDWYRMMARPWENVVRTMTHEEQMDLICRYAPAAAVLYAFQNTEFEALLTAEVKQRAAAEPPMSEQANYRTAAVPADRPQYSQTVYQAQPQYSQYSQPAVQPAYQPVVQEVPAAQLPIQGSAFPAAPVEEPQPQAPKAEFHVRGPLSDEVAARALGAMTNVNLDAGDPNEVPF